MAVLAGKVTNKYTGPLSSKKDSPWDVLPFIWISRLLLKMQALPYPTTYTHRVNIGTQQYSQFTWIHLIRIAFLLAVWLDQLFQGMRTLIEFRKGRRGLYGAHNLGLGQPESNMRTAGTWCARWGRINLHPWRARHVLDAFHMFSYLVNIMQTNEVSPFLHTG